MFISFTMRSSGTNFDYTIIDDDFTDVISGCIYVDVIIEVYEKRNLPVIPNLIRAILYDKRNMSDITKLIDASKQLSVKYNKYEVSIDKYLLLL